MKASTSTRSIISPFRRYSFTTLRNEDPSLQFSARRFSTQSQSPIRMQSPIHTQHPIRGQSPIHGLPPVSVQSNTVQEFISVLDSLTGVKSDTNFNPGNENV
ncbi:MAG: hypothetical protein EZS28_022463 [Streblomastix strix]|uniref:Uncharacterized protein n=1 Tax=Streblomastix strix TaxID=222440 RepID=A0A5J4VHP0_9EUKA|nr:MAG: hypothetical protein EZS28_022463 [Streblomastix strix]